MNTRFLKCIPIVAAMSLVNAACKKMDFKPDINYTTLKVLEVKTNLPIEGAKVEIYKCTKYGWGGCADLSLVKTVTTDKHGNFQFESNLNAYFIEASENRYWRGASGGETFGGVVLPVTDIFLTPLAYTKIHLKKINPHPVGIFLVVHVAPDSSFLFGSRAAFDLPADTTFIVESYGNSNNLVRWYFTDGMGKVDSSQTGGLLPSYYINRFDTASVELNY